ncbi:MAG: 3'-5' exonuclease [Polyangiaceae bacterium]|nr:3'-5' exonuclease [Polyangiaceae bacterium]
MSQRPAEPPPGPPWDLPIAEAPLAFVDLELSGLSPERDRIIEVCIVRVHNGAVVDRVATLVRPEPMTFGNEAIHGIAVSDLTGAPTFAEIAPSIVGILNDAIFVAHAANKDAAFLEAEMARISKPFSMPFYVDTLSLSRRAFALKNHSLVHLCKELGIAHGRAHRAESDVTAMREVYTRILAVLHPTTPRDLWHVRVGERHARPELLAAAERARKAETNVLIRYRPSHRAAEDLEMRVTGVRTDLDPPRVLGYLLASRSRRELRADRILSIAEISTATKIG